MSVPPRCLGSHKNCTANSPTPGDKEIMEGGFFLQGFHLETKRFFVGRRIIPPLLRSDSPFQCCSYLLSSPLRGPYQDWESDVLGPVLSHRKTWPFRQVQFFFFPLLLFSASPFLAFCPCLAVEEISQFTVSEQP